MQRMIVPSFLRFVTLVGWMLLSMTGLVNAGEPTDGGSRFGVGVSIWHYDVVYFPVRLSSRIRLEPEFSLSWTKSNYTSNFDDQELESSSKSTEIRAGSGIFLVDARGPINLLYGARAGYKRNRNMGNGGLSHTGNGYFMSPVFGVEYFLTGHFGIGGEVQLEYSHGHYTNYVDSIEGDQSHYSSLSTESRFSIRWYP